MSCKQECPTCERLQRLAVEIVTDGDGVDSLIGGSALFKLSEGDNDVRVVDTAIGGDLVVRTGTGSDTVQIGDGTVVSGTKRLRTGGGGDVLP